MPLCIASWVGGFITFISGIVLLGMLIRSLIGLDVNSTSLIITVVLFMGGSVLLSTGIIGEYLAKTYDEVRRRPHYIVKRIYD